MTAQVPEAESSAESMHRAIILDHARLRHGYRAELPPRAGWAGRHAVGRQENPVCGDEVTVLVRRSTAPDPVVSDLLWTGEGCSISQAATSMLHGLVTGVPVARVREVLAEYRRMVRSRGTAVPDERTLGDAVALAGVGRHPNRVTCAMLGWTALEDALSRCESSPWTARGEHR